MSKLASLRKNPETAINNGDFIVDIMGCALAPNKVVPRVQEGVNVKIVESDAGSNTTCLAISPGGEDYYFPWVNRGVGHVTVPGNVKEGTLVVTGGMNGCALQVNDYNGNLIFYHDADNQYLGTLHQPQGQQLIRIEPRLYMLIPYGQTIVEESPKEGLAYMYQLICVRCANKWLVVYSGLIVKSVKGKLAVVRTFTPGVSKVLGSF